MPKKSLSYADPLVAGAYLWGLKTAFAEALKELSEIYGPEGPERMAEFKARVMRQIKSTASEGMDEATEVRLLTHAMEVVDAAFDTFAKPADDH